MAKRNPAQDVETLVPGAVSTNGGAATDGLAAAPISTDIDRSEEPEGIDADNPTGETPYDLSLIHI